MKLQNGICTSERDVTSRFLCRRPGPRTAIDLVRCGARVILLAFAFSWIWGCHRSTTFRPTSQDVEEHNRAVALMGQFNYEAAWEVLAGLAKAHPEWLDVQVDWAIATLNRRQSGDGEKAVEVLRSVATRDSSNLRALYCEAILRLDSGEPELAGQLFQRVADADPQDAYAQYYTGQCLSQLGKVEQSLPRFEKAIALDPYLRSSYYGAFQACLRLEKADKADEYRKLFERLEKNPQSRLAEIKYTRMGPKATLHALKAELPQAQRPMGPLFGPSVALIGAKNVVHADATSSVPQITVADLYSDGPQILFLAQASADPNRPNVVLRANREEWEHWSDHVLSQVTNVLAVLWGDYDNDGLTDAYFCRSGPNQLWRQVAPDQWQDVTESTGTSGGDVVTRDGQMFDADHDGDLDIFLVNDGPNELLNNNLNGTFRPLAAEQGLQGRGANSKSAIVLDLDADRDLDILVVNETPPHEAYVNDRLWTYHPAFDLDELLHSPLRAAVAADWDADGQTEIWDWTDTGLVQWTPDAKGRWKANAWKLNGVSKSEADVSVGLSDVDGDGRLDLVKHTPAAWEIWDLTAKQRLERREEASSTWRLVNRPATGPAMVAYAGQESRWSPPGPGRFDFLTLKFTGKDEQSDQMRSNRSGIGVWAASRRGSQWTSLRTLRADSLPGQDLQPVAVGLGGQETLDFVSVTWPDGVYQTEYDLERGRSVAITETQRQVASCPLIFAWNGTSYAFVTDVLGGGGLGFNVGRGEYSAPRSVENLLLPNGLLQPRDSAFAIKVSEPMEEVCYLDCARLVRYRLPADWSMALDERFAVQGPAPTGSSIFYRKCLAPVAAQNDRGEPVLTAVLSADGVAADPGERDVRFLGRTTTHSVELEFAEPLDSIETPFLLMDGWIEYPYSQTMFAAWQAGVRYEAPTIEAQDHEGRWQVISLEFGYPAGMPRQAVLPLDRSKLPVGTRRLRISTNMEIYWDRFAVIAAELPSKVQRDVYALRAAHIAEAGYASRTVLAQRRPVYDYDRRRPFGDSRHLKGFYSEFGPVRDLVETVDDNCAIFGPGEEVHLEFHVAPVRTEWIGAHDTEASAVSADALPTVDGEGFGNKQNEAWVLELNGWCKDMDLYTRDGETVEPLPARDLNAKSATASEPGRMRETRRWRYRGGN